MIDRLSPGDAFVALIDHGADNAGAPVFAVPFAPWPLRPDDFDPSATPVMKSGVVFAQRFFNLSGRAFVLFAGLHEGRGRAAPVGQVNLLLAGLKINQRA